MQAAMEGQLNLTTMKNWQLTVRLTDKEEAALQKAMEKHPEWMHRNSLTAFLETIAHDAITKTANGERPERWDTWSGD